MKGKTKRREKGNRKDLYKSKCIKRAFEVLHNQILDLEARSQFSEVIRSAQLDVDYWRLGVFDIDSLIYDYAERRFKALFELKSRETVNYLSGYFQFKESQYIVTKTLAEALGVPFYWLIYNKEGNLWYVTDVLKAGVQIVKDESMKYDKWVRLDKDSFIMMGWEEFMDWLIQNIF